MSESETYVAWNPCGCVAGVTVNDPNYQRDVAKAVADFIRAGGRVELKPTEWVRTTPNLFAACSDNPECRRRPKPRQKEMAL